MMVEVWMIETGTQTHTHAHPLFSQLCRWPYSCVKKCHFTMGLAWVGHRALHRHVPLFPLRQGRKSEKKLPGW